MEMHRRLFRWGMLLFLLAVPCRAEPLTVTLDPAKSRLSIRFHATMHNVDGSLGPASGVFQLDPSTGQASGEIRMDFSGATTELKRRDRKMHQKILETHRYPGATFHVERVVVPRQLRPGKNDVQLWGKVDFHGASHEVSLPAEVTLDGQGFRARGWIEVPYISWGLRDPSVFLMRVAPVVTVEVDVVGTVSPAPL